MTAYVLTLCHLCVDSGECEYTVMGVYGNLEDARRDMASLVRETKRRYDGCDYETRRVETNEVPSSWTIWEKSDYMSHHSSIQISKSEGRQA